MTGEGIKISKAAFLRKIPPGARLTLKGAFNPSRSSRIVKKANSYELVFHVLVDGVDGGDESSLLWNAGDQIFEHEEGFRIVSGNNEVIYYHGTTNIFECTVR